MKKRFTLTEVLVVVFLIGVLTAIGFGMYSYAMNSARESATRALFSRLDAALESCNTKFGYIPISQNKEFTILRVKDCSDKTYPVPGDAKTKNFSYVIGFEGKDPDLPSDDAERQSLGLWMEEFMKTLDIESLQKNFVRDGQLVDAWGNPVYYCYPGKFNKTSYDLYSPGADGRFGKDAEKEVDLNALNQGNLGSLKENTEVLCDDIFNF